MMRRDGPSPDRSGLAARVAQVIEMRYHGNAAAAARKLGVDPKLILRVIRRGQTPPTPLLAALVADATVNAEWLLQGPRAAEESPEEGLTRRVRYVSLVQGALPLTPPLWPYSTGVQTECPAALPWQTTYAYEVAHNNPLVEVKEYKIDAGDLLFLNTDLPIRVTCLMGTWHDRVVVWRWQSPPSRPDEPARPVMMLGDLRRGENGPEARLFGPRIEPRPFDETLPGTPNPMAPPPDLGPGGTLGYLHLAAVCVASLRIAIDALDQLRRL